MQTVSVGIREAKINLSKLLKMVQKGNEVILTDRKRPVCKLVPIKSEALPFLERIKRLEDRGLIAAKPQGKSKIVPLPIPVQDDLAQKLLQEDREYA